MLKAQLRSKSSALRSMWQDVEDILTGQFSGVLDYLPRRICLPSFISWIAAFNDSVSPSSLDAVDWDRIEFLSWPMLYAQEDAAEPDLVIVSTRWVLLVEVKLESWLGTNQPWREYAWARRLHGIAGCAPRTRPRFRSAAVSPLGGLEVESDHREARHRRSLAPRRLPALLELEIAEAELGRAED